MKELLKYISIFSVITVCILLIAFKMMDIDTKKSDKSYALKVVQMDTHWIYEISHKNKLLIRQEYIPTVKGKQVFKSEKDAKVIGKIVLEKLTDNEIPRITVKDLKSNKIIFKDI